MSADYPVIRLSKDASFNEWPEHLRVAEINDWCEQTLLPELRKLNPKNQHAFGEDFGRLGDLTVIDPIAIEQNLDRVVPFSVERRQCWQWPGVLPVAAVRDGDRSASQGTVDRKHGSTAGAAC